MNHPPDICDYEGSDYQDRFWDQQGRDYEDQVERIALKRLLPAQGHTLIDIGAGFGRLANEYDGYQRVVLFDYSRSLLRQAQARFEADPRFIFVVGNWYQMPFVPGLFDALVQIRTIHHAADVPALFAELVRIANNEATYVLEFASKRHLKAILRYWLGRQSWSPFAREPLEFAALNFDFHPVWMRQKLVDAGFSPGRKLTVSHLRLGLLKKLFPTRLLVQIDSALQNTARYWQLTPSLFISSASPASSPVASGRDFFACPECGTLIKEFIQGQNICSNEACAHQWTYQDGLYDFKPSHP